MSTGDDIGRIFYWNGNIFRGINESRVGEVRELFSSGLIAELAGAKIFPETEITGYTLENYPLVLSHKAIKSVTYPYEWSFEMMKAAALTILKVNEILIRYGYQTKDCHSFNVLFDGTHPYYIDLGSFTKVDPNTKYFVWQEEFLRSYAFMFYIGRTNDYHWVRQLHVSDQLISYESFLFYKYRWIRSLSYRNQQRVVKLSRLFTMGESIEERIKKRRFGGLVAAIVKMFSSPNTIPKLREQVLKARKKSYKTTWGEYQSTFDESNPRFNRLIELIKGRGIKSVFEVAGNQGFFANMMLTKGGVEHVFCSDYDENAVDAMFQRYPDRHDLSPVLMNLLFQPQTSFTQPAPARFKSDMVVALAILHHIVLTQRQSVDFFLSTLMKYTNKFVLVEFMPMGLWDSVTDTAPPVPDWYNVEWFRTHFQKYFTILHEETVAKNRIAFLGEIVNKS
jgi:hypothetical protein